MRTGLNLVGRTPAPRRTGGLIVWIVAGVVVASCLATAGATWNRWHAANVSVDDAVRVIAHPIDEAEREQALGVIGGRFEDLMRVIIAEEQRGGPTAKFATKYLERATKTLQERAK